MSEHASSVGGSWEADGVPVDIHERWGREEFIVVLNNLIAKQLPSKLKDTSLNPYNYRFPKISVIENLREYNLEREYRGE